MWLVGMKKAPAQLCRGFVSHLSRYTKQIRVQYVQ